jgi:tRNA threonylcarbamoyladenosine biosynthesis protein TsaB
MLTLAIDASTYSASVALLDGAAMLAEMGAAMRGADEERLLPAIASLFEQAKRTPREVTAIVCGAGPGSFTSLRIAGATAKGLALAAGAPLYAVSSLALIVAGAEATRTSDRSRWMATADAMRGEYFSQCFDTAANGSVFPAGPVTLLAREELSAHAEALDAMIIGPDQVVHAFPRAAGILRIPEATSPDARVSVESWEPAYGRLAEAQVRWEAEHGRPLPRS